MKDTRVKGMTFKVCAGRRVAKVKGNGIWRGVREEHGEKKIR